MSYSPRVQIELAAADRLPSPEGVALEVLRLARRPDVTNAQIARAVQADPALAARLIRAANAPSLGPRRPVVAIGDAVLILGLPALRSLVLGFALIDRYRSGACRQFDYVGFWSQSLLRALVCQSLALRVRVAAPEESFACGLLAAVGQLALATLHPTEYGRIVESHPGLDAGALAPLERAALGTDSIEIGVWLLGNWGFPAPFLQALAARIDPDCARLQEGSRNLALARGFRLADGVVRAAAVPGERLRRELPDLLSAAAKLGIDRDGLQAICDEALEAWREWSRLLEVPHDAVGRIELAPHHPAPGPEVPGAAQITPGLRVLLVAGRGAERDAIARLLDGEQHQVAIAADAADARAAAVRLRPQAVVVDDAAPGLAGSALLESLRATQLGRGVFVLVLVDSEDDERLGRLLDAGADDFLVKPLKPRRLIARLRAASRVLCQQEQLARNASDLRRFADQLALDNRRLERAAVTDSLTGLPNRRYALARLEQEWSAARRRKASVACIVVDIDRFKRINDCFGHEEGDRVLRAVAEVLRRTARTEDIVCRVGGEEFLVVCPNASVPEARHCAERLREAVAEARIGPGARGGGVTISAGVAASGLGLASPAELVRRADIAMYDAKSRGRNRVSVHPGEIV